MKKIFILCGEPSGDSHASKLIPYINQSDIEIKAVGGSNLQRVGVELVHNIELMAFMGVVDVVKNIFKIQSNFKHIKREIKLFNPDIILLIDYPGFNLKMAKFSKKLGIKVIYYITPKIWAWKEKRAFTIKKWVDEVITIFPFEKEFYKRFNIKTEYFGHPITEGLVPNFTEQEFFEFLGTEKIIGLLPGSRKSEILYLLPDMIEVIREYKDKGYRFVISKVEYLDRALYAIPEDLRESVSILENDQYSIMAYSRFLIIASGTANLEAACFHTPMVVIYKVSKLSYFIAKLFVKLKLVSPVNIVYGAEIVKELIQDNCTKDNLIKATDDILESYQEKVNLLEQLHLLLKKENVSKNVAQFICSKF
jgi:lipid-A-disaccharide synthase